MAQVTMLPTAEVNEIVSHLDGVIGAVYSTAQAGAGRARGVLARHRHEGHSRITVTRGDKTDSFVNLDDTRGQRAAAAIEYGHSGRRAVGALAAAF